MQSIGEYVKICSQCGLEKSLEDFYACSGSRCKICKYKQNLDWQSRNKGRVRRLNKTWQDTHVDRLRSSARKWSSAHPEKAREYTRRWRKTHPEQTLIIKRNRYARQSGAEGSHGADDVKHIFDKQDGVCANVSCCKQLSMGYHVDHIMPLILGGGNGPENLQLLCPSCNHKKGAKHPQKWLMEESKRRDQSGKPGSK